MVVRLAVVALGWMIARALGVVVARAAERTAFPAESLANDVDLVAAGALERRLDANHRLIDALNTQAAAIPLVVVGVATLIVPHVHVGPPIPLTIILVTLMGSAALMAVVTAVVALLVGGGRAFLGATMVAAVVGPCAVTELRVAVDNAARAHQRKAAWTGAAVLCSLVALLSLGALAVTGAIG